MDDFHSNAFRDDERISAYLDGELADDERAQVERLLREQPAARQVLEELQAMRAGFLRLPNKLVPADLMQSITKRMQARGGEASPLSATAPQRIPQVVLPIAMDRTVETPAGSSSVALSVCESKGRARRPLARGIAWFSFAAAAAIAVCVSIPWRQVADHEVASQTETGPPANRAAVDSIASDREERGQPDTADNVSDRESGIVRKSSPDVRFSANADAGGGGSPIPSPEDGTLDSPVSSPAKRPEPTGIRDADSRAGLRRGTAASPKEIGGSSPGFNPSDKIESDKYNRTTAGGKATEPELAKREKQRSVPMIPTALDPANELRIAVAVAPAAFRGKVFEDLLALHGLNAAGNPSATPLADGSAAKSKANSAANLALGSGPKKAESLDSEKPQQGTAQFRADTSNKDVHAKGEAEKIAEVRRAQQPQAEARLDAKADSRTNASPGGTSGTGTVARSEQTATVIVIEASAAELQAVLDSLAENPNAFGQVEVIAVPKFDEQRSRDDRLRALDEASVRDAKSAKPAPSAKPAAAPKPAVSRVRVKFVLEVQPAQP